MNMKEFEKGIQLKITIEQAEIDEALKKVNLLISKLNEAKEISRSLGGTTVVNNNFQQ